MGDGALVAFGQSFQGMHIKDLNELEPGFWPDGYFVPARWRLQHRRCPI
jgi:hypothetical protein